MTSIKCFPFMPSQKVDQYLDDLMKFDKENIHQDVLKAIRPYLESPEFNPEFVKSKSLAAAGA